MSITAGQFLERFVAWQWLATIVMAEYAVLVWQVVHWYMELKDPTAAQFLASLVISTGLPIMTKWYLAAMQRVYEFRAGIPPAPEV